MHQYPSGIVNEVFRQALSVSISNKICFFQLLLQYIMPCFNEWKLKWLICELCHHNLSQSALTYEQINKKNNEREVSFCLRERSKWWVSGTWSIRIWFANYVYWYCTINIDRNIDRTCLIYNDRDCLKNTKCVINNSPSSFFCQIQFLPSQVLTNFIFDKFRFWRISFYRSFFWQVLIVPHIPSDLSKLKLEIAIINP